MLFAAVILDFRVTLGHEGVSFHRGVCEKLGDLLKKGLFFRTCERGAGENSDDFRAHRGQVFEGAGEN